MHKSKPEVTKVVSIDGNGVNLPVYQAPLKVSFNNDYNREERNRKEVHTF